MSERENNANQNPILLTQEEVKKGPIKITIGDIKAGGALATILTGAGLMGFAPDGSPGKYAGGVIFLGMLAYPLVEIAIEEFESLIRGNDLNQPHQTT